MVGRIRLSVSTASRTYELWEETHVTPFRTDFIRLGSVTTNRKNVLSGEQHAVGTDLVSTGPSRRVFVLTEWSHVGYSREFVGTVYCTYGQSNSTINRIVISSVGQCNSLHQSNKERYRKRCVKASGWCIEAQLIPSRKRLALRVTINLLFFFLHSFGICINTMLPEASF